MRARPPSFRSALRLLGARARALNAGAPPRGASTGPSHRTRPLPALFLLTDPQRTPDPVAAASALPRGSAIIYRAFGAANRLAVARALARLARRRGLALLIGEDEQLAVRAGADGLHLPERGCARARALRRRHPEWIITVAAHAPGAIAAAARAGADAALVSPVFATSSHPGARPLGADRAAAWARGAIIPVIALGGVNVHTVAQLRGGFAGIAAIGGLTAGSVRI